MKTWSDYHREALDVGMDDASACHAADSAMKSEQIAELRECLILAVKDLEVIEVSRYSRGICERARKALAL